jgi:hypothetical protein
LQRCCFTCAEQLGQKRELSADTPTFVLLSIGRASPMFGEASGAAPVTLGRLGNVIGDEVDLVGDLKGLFLNVLG